MVHFEVIDASSWREGAGGGGTREEAVHSVWCGVSGDHTSAALTQVETETFTWKKNDTDHLNEHATLHPTPTSL